MYDFVSNDFDDDMYGESFEWDLDDVNVMEDAAAYLAVSDDDGDASWASSDDAMEWE
jgi:hypothetical protein